MFRSALCASSWRSTPFRPTQDVLLRRSLSTKLTPRKSRTWKSTAFRWGLVIGGVYYYNTHDLFAHEPEVVVKEAVGLEESNQDISQITINAIVEQRRQRQALKPEEQHSRAEVVESQDSSVQVNKHDETKQEKEGDSADETPQGQEGAFDPETGTINWDCPCLGGMAHGPCGEEFKAAFSCFVYSKEEPKGVECIDKFKNMQTCFREYPEIYGAELDDDTSESDKDEGTVIEDVEKPSLVSEQSIKPISADASNPIQINLNPKQESDKDN